MNNVREVTHPSYFIFCGDPRGASCPAAPQGGKLMNGYTILSMQIKKKLSCRWQTARRIRWDALLSLFPKTAPHTSRVLTSPYLVTLGKTVW